MDPSASSDIINAARSASDSLDREIEHARRVGQAAKDLSDRWAQLAAEEQKRLQEDEARRLLKQQVLDRVARMTRDELTKLKMMITEVK